jgi:hypothetical protein
VGTGGENIQLVYELAMEQNVIYKDPKSILVINPKGNMRQLFCPFRVRVFSSDIPLSKNSYQFVTEVREYKASPLQYKIGHSWYDYQYFGFLITF